MVLEDLGHGVGIGIAVGVGVGCSCYGLTHLTGGLIEERGTTSAQIFISPHLFSISSQHISGRDTYRK